MRHDWIFEVLADMKSYADRHGLVALSAKVDETAAVARAEIAGAESDRAPNGKPSGDTSGKPN